MSLLKKIDFSLVTLKPNSLVYGSTGEFEYKSTINYTQQVLYYIPKSLKKNTINASTIVFMHGGGISTGGKPAGSLKVATDYLKSLKKTLEKKKTIIFNPVSPLNWGWNTMFVTKEIAAISSKILKSDPNRSVLMGHSMGGMGIGRSAMYLVDHFSGLMPLSSGVADKHLVATRLKTYLNTAVRRQVGKSDHFDFFLKSSLKEELLVNNLSTELKIKNNHKTKAYKGGHGYNLKLVGKELSEILEKYPRNLYQSRIFPVFYNSNRTLQIYQYKNLKLHNINRSFWLEAISYEKLSDNNSSILSSGEAMVNDNTYSIKLSEGASLKKIRVFISDKMVDMNKPIRIVINNKTYFDGVVDLNLNRSVQIQNYMNDPSYKFENCIDLTL